MNSTLKNVPSLFKSNMLGISVVLLSFFIVNMSSNVFAADNAQHNASQEAVSLNQNFQNVDIRIVI